MSIRPYLTTTFSLLFTGSELSLAFHSAFKNGARGLLEPLSRIFFSLLRFLTWILGFIFLNDESPLMTSLPSRRLFFRFAWVAVGVDCFG
jgi:hypothetical protein